MRVAITTDRFDSVSSHYGRLGLEPVAAPCVQVLPGPGLAEARRAARGADVLVVASARTVEFLWPGTEMPDVPVAAVGVATARAVESRRGRVVVSGKGGLLDLLRAAADQLADRRVVFPHASGTDAAGIAAMAALAGTLEAFEVYRTVPVAPPDVTVDAVAFASPSAVEGWHLSHRLDGLVVGAIGGTTAKAVARHRPADVVASFPSHAELAAALVRRLEVAR